MTHKLIASANALAALALPVTANAQMYPIMRHPHWHTFITSQALERHTIIACPTPSFPSTLIPAFSTSADRVSSLSITSTRSLVYVAQSTQASVRHATATSHA